MSNPDTNTPPPSNRDSFHILRTIAAAVVATPVVSSFVTKTPISFTGGMMVLLALAAFGSWSVDLGVFDGTAKAEAEKAKE